MCNQVEIVLNNERCWDKRWLKYFSQHRASFHFRPSDSREISNLIQNDEAPLMKSNESGDVYDILFNKICVGLLFVTPYENNVDAEISIAILDDYTGKSIARRAIQLYISQTAYSKIYGVVYGENQYRKQMNHIFLKTGFHEVNGLDKIEENDITREWCIDIR